jgi:periplasmic protein TonB
LRREAFVLNELSWWRAMPIGLSCLLHVGLVAGLIAGQQWVTSVVSQQPPVLPVQLVTLDAGEPPREIAPPAPPRRERQIPVRREPPKPREVAAAKIEEPAPQPVAPVPAPATAPTPAPVPPDTGPAPTATLPAIGEPAPAPGPPAPASSGNTVALPPSAPIVASKPSTAPPDGVTRTPRPQGGYQVRPAYPSAPRRLGIQGTTMLRVHVLADGRIGDVLVDRSAGHPDLDRAAMEAVRRWRFEPARRGADAVAMWVLLPVEFRLTQ